MKLAFVVVLALASGCSINHRSDQFACTKNTDCDSGRVCSDGYCVVSGSQVDAPRGDGPRGDGSSGNCPAGCTSCNTSQRTCTINCMLTDCTNTITCPAGYKCDIACNTENSCRDGINCLFGASCDVECSAKSSCEGVQCGPGPCAVACSGPQSCRNVSCGNSCACDITCTGSESCSQGIQCTSQACRSSTGRGCTSVPTFCHSCN